jgi:hypothetical protein
MALFSILLIKSVGCYTLFQLAAICILWWKDIPSCPPPLFPTSGSLSMGGGDYRVDHQHLLIIFTL